MEEKMEKQCIELAYARVSTNRQNLDRQEQSIQEAVPNLKAVYFFEDRYTGKEFDRVFYHKLKDKICEIREIDKDVPIRLTVHELDRLGRDYREIQNEVYWFRRQHVTLNFLDIPTELISETMGITGEFLLDIIILLKSYWAEQELHVKAKRTKEGIAKARAKGVRFGRPEIEVDRKQFESTYNKWKAGEITAKEAMKQLKLKPNTFYRKVHNYESELSS